MRIHNFFRKVHHAQPLKLSSILSLGALQNAKKLLAQGTLQSSDVSSGESVALKCSEEFTVADAVKTWYLQSICYLKKFVYFYIHLLHIAHYLHYSTSLFHCLVFFSALLSPIHSISINGAFNFSFVFSICISCASFVFTSMNVIEISPCYERFSKVHEGSPLCVTTYKKV